jgi:hypothetical protein
MRSISQHIPATHSSCSFQLLIPAAHYSCSFHMAYEELNHNISDDNSDVDDNLDSYCHGQNVTARDSWPEACSPDGRYAKSWLTSDFALCILIVAF